MIPIDLNLLQTFDVLFELRSTTRAADRLGLSQSAVSHALRRLREAMGDPLFIRSGRSLQPTARALEIAPEVHAGLMRLRAALASGEFDPAVATRTITLAFGSYLCTLVAPRLIAWAREIAPGITFRLVPLERDLPAMLEDGSVDVAGGLFENVPDRFATRPLFTDDFVWIAARDHPLAGRRITRAEIHDFPHLRIGTVHPFGMPSTLLKIRQMADVTGLEGQAGSEPRAFTYDAMTAIATVSASDLIAQVPRRLANVFAPSMGVVFLDAPNPPDSLTLSALWHSRLREDAAIGWLLDYLAELDP